ncbi:MAG: ATP-binding protein [bacterium]
MISFKRIGLLILAILGMMFLPVHQLAFASDVDDIKDIDEKRLPCVLEEESRYHIISEDLGLFVEDIDEDGRDEILFAERWDPGTTHLIYFDEKIGIFQWDLPFQNSVIHSPFCANLDSKGDQEIIIPEKRGNVIFLNVYSSDRDSIIRFKALEGKDFDGNGIWDGQIVPHFAEDLNGDGYKDIIVAVRAGRDLQPRGIYAYDVKSGKEVWRYKTGPHIEKIFLRDLDGDDTSEIIASSYAPANGSEANNTDDSHSYLIVLSKDGDLLWQFETGGKFSGCNVRIDDIDRDGKIEIILATYSVAAKPEDLNRITMLRGEEGTVIREIRLSSSFPNLELGDIDLDGNKEIFIGGDSGDLLVFNSKLEVVKKSRYPAKVEVLLVDDIDNDGEKEIFVSIGDSKTLVLKSKLEPLAIFDDTLLLYSLRTGVGETKKLLLSSKGYLYLLNFKKRLLPPLPWKYLFGGFFGGILLLVIGFYAVRKLRPPPIVTRLKKDLLDDITIGIISIDKDGKLSYLNEQAKSVLKLKGRSPVGQGYQTVFQNEELKALCELIDKSYTGYGESKKDEIRLRIGTEGRELLAEVLPLLDTRDEDLGRLIIVEDITKWSQSERAMAWISMARQLAHEIKNPLANIMITLQCLQREYKKDRVSRSEAYDELVTSTIDEIMRLRNVANGFMRFAKLEKPNLQPNNVNRIINETLAEYSQRIPGTIHVKKVLAENLPPARVDEEQVQTMLANLIENSVNAMPDGGALTISTALIQEFPQDHKKIGTDFVSIEIADTGGGISEEDLKKVFDPYFSKSKEGVGLGLVIVNRIIEDHGGSINIYSREGIGTTITIELPVNGEVTDKRMKATDIERINTQWITGGSFRCVYQLNEFVYQIR